jgi:hypothetical protein
MREAIPLILKMPNPIRQPEYQDPDVLSQVLDGELLVSLLRARKYLLLVMVCEICDSLHSVGVDVPKFPPPAYDNALNRQLGLVYSVKQPLSQNTYRRTSSFSNICAQFENGGAGGAARNRVFRESLGLFVQGRDDTE